MNEPHPKRRWRPWPRSLMWQNVMVLVCLAVVIHVSVLGAHLVLLKQTVIGATEAMVNQIQIMNGALSRVDPARRADAIAFLDRQGLLAIEGEPPPASDLPPNPVPYSLMSGRMIQQRLAPDVEFRWAFVDKHEDAHFWVRMNVAGTRTWFAGDPDHSEKPIHPLSITLLLGLLLGTLATVVALLIQRRINRPLRDIAAAARALGDGGRQAHLPGYGAAELASLATQFNAMVDSLKEAETARALMLAGISHDVRTPLARLRMALALQGGESEAMAARCIRQVDAVIGQFLDFGHVGNGELPVECDLNVLVEQTAAEFEADGHPFELQLQPLPRQTLRPVAMQRVIQNLMDNALKYAGSGLQVRTWLQDGEVQLVVADRGPGLAAGERVRVKQAFVRGAGVSDVGGLGLGLAIVERLLQLHGGRLQLLDREGGGMEARVSLPLPNPTW